MHACDDCIHACDDYILHACTQRLESLPNTMQAPRGARGSAAGRRIGLIHTQARLGHGHGPHHVTNSSFCCRPVARARPPRRGYTPPAQPAPGFAILCSCCSVSHLLRKCSMFSITKMKCACGSTVTDAIELYTVRLAAAAALRKGYANVTLTSYPSYYPSYWSAEGWAHLVHLPEDVLGVGEPREGLLRRHRVHVIVDAVLRLKFRPPPAPPSPERISRTKPVRLSLSLRFNTLSG